MRNLIVKVIVSILATILLVCGVQSTGYGQKNLVDAGISTAQILREDQIYDKAIRSVMWIITLDGRQASGVLVDKKRKLAVTNEHVTKNNRSVVVVFPVRDGNGNLISDRSFYVDESHLKVLSRLGYATEGRVIAESPKRDLAIVQLVGIPETARAIDHDFSHHAYLDMNARDPVDILGNPGGRDLWRWTAGRFQAVSGELLHINAGTYGGNSGGPVLNNRGILIGILKSSDELMYTQAVPSEYINDLLKTLKTRQVFSISNNTRFTVHYQIKWTESEAWEHTSVNPDQWYTHWNSELLTKVPQGYPVVRFDHIADGETVTFKSYNMQTYTRIFGSDVKERISREDARKYHLGYGSKMNELVLYDSEDK